MGKVIIFGGCGFLGSWIVRAFLKKGYNVSIFDLKIKKELVSLVAVSYTHLTLPTNSLV